MCKDIPCPAAQLIGDSPSMKEVRRQIRLLAPTDLPVLLLGETGTGKEIAARAIASLSGRATYVPVNIAAVPVDLADSELFGHVKGAFTGATSDRAGLFAVAHDGTLFLDEIGDTPLPIQVKLLRALESGEFRRLGSNRIEYSNPRPISATNVDMAAAVDQGRIRVDFMYRMASNTIRIPALRDHAEDISSIAQHLLDEFRKRFQPVPDRLSPGALNVLGDFAWPGNVRQLRAVIERSVIEAGACARLDAEPIMKVLHNGTFPDAEAGDTPSTLSDVVSLAEDIAVRRALAAANGHVKRAAGLLKVHPATVYRILKRRAQDVNGAAAADQAEASQDCEATSPIRRRHAKNSTRADDRSRC